MRSFCWISSVSLHPGFATCEMQPIRHSHMKALASAATILEVLNLKSNEFSGTLPNITSLPDALGKWISSMLLLLVLLPSSFTINIVDFASFSLPACRLFRRGQESTISRSCT